MLEALRDVLLACGLGETIKWRAPCYTHAGGNVAIIGRRTEGVVLSFFQGALLEEGAGLLRAPGEHSRATRIVTFSRADQIVELESVISGYVRQAMALVEAGRRVDFSADRKMDLPAELERAFGEWPALQEAFYRLTAGRQRGYLLYFSGAKQTASRTARIDRYAERILAGSGIHDCVCGKSARMPRCDGSHSRQQ